jgi:hypothetical protein
MKRYSVRATETDGGVIIIADSMKSYDNQVVFFDHYYWGLVKREVGSFRGPNWLAVLEEE